MNPCVTIALAIALAGCTASGNARPAQSALSPADELPLPVLPDTMKQPDRRATYLLSHFWDAMNFADTTLTRNSEFMERNFANFVNIYPHAIADSLPDITSRFLARAISDPQSRALIYDIIIRYLSSPDSPVRSDDTYITFLSRWVELPGLDSYELIEPRYRLAAALKNRPGTQAADFSYVTTDGTQATLHTTEAPQLLLMLYDPDCDHCMTTIAALRADTTVNRLIDLGLLKVLAVYVESDLPLWESTVSQMPRNWTVGADRSAIIDNELYDIPDMPGIYLLDRDKTVTLRQPTVDTLLHTLSSP